MDIYNQESHDDPQFTKVLETCLNMEIATIKRNLDASTEEIKQLKVTMRSELNRRKELKGKMAQMNNIKFILTETLRKLRINISEISDTIETMKANADDQYKLIQLRSQEYQDLVAEYRKTWHEYRAEYEEFPSAKARNEAKIKLEKVKIEYMVTSYKKTEIIKIIKQRRRINWIRMRCKIVDFATVMSERLKLEEKLSNLKVNVKYHRRELQSIESELQVLRRKEEDQKKQRKQKMLEMAPPKINIPFRELYAQNQMRARMQHQWKQAHEPSDDTISVNTLFLEELCINENAMELPEEIIDIEEIHDDACKLPAIETEMSNIKNTVSSEKDDARDVSVAMDAEPSAEKVMTVTTENDVEMKETHHEKTQKSQESVRTQPSCRIKESPLKHSAAKNTQDEIAAKRIRLQRQESKESINKITTILLPSTVKEKDLKSTHPSPHPSIPQIKKIETVNYNITQLMPIPKPIPLRSTATASSMFSPMRYEYCDSNMSSLDQDFVSKGQPSLYEGSLCNYRLSPTSNMSFCIEENARMASFTKSPAQQDNKIESDDKTSAFQFSAFVKKAKDSNLF
ncbi:PREDICTED: CAP-Gly domain-containing linker protein 1-like [Wasmannia auropunctata]|uniref:CAP-Gly domain-containing linker protein 1-like n=1 Tax=Wasmannia auropunctata TaxID=64793 RepID=UPI0005F0512C|nr:PREDICTED: CAP-Gly domain-containing linker protein 1-like [Wasmannia auropunctata]